MIKSLKAANLYIWKGLKKWPSNFGHTIECCQVFWSQVEYKIVCFIIEMRMTENQTFMQNLYFSVDYVLVGQLGRGEGSP